MFVLVWLALLAADVVWETYRIPFWFNCVGIGTLAYALGLNVAELTAYRGPFVRRGRPPAPASESGTGPARPG